jgi:hypothetical protein
MGGTEDGELQTFNERRVGTNNFRHDGDSYHYRVRNRSLSYTSFTLVE